MRSLHPSRSLRGKTHRSDPVSSRYCCFKLRSVTKRQPELVVQTLATINICRWSFPAGGSLSAGGSPSAGGSTVGSTFGLRPRNASGTSRCHAVPESCRGCCCGNLWSAGGGSLWNAGGCVFVMPAVMQPGLRAPRSTEVARLCCRASKGRCSLW